MTTSTQNDKPYGFYAEFEDAIVWKCITSQTFYNRIGFAVDADLLAQDHAKLLVRGAHIIYETTKAAPGGPAMVLQRLSTLCADGKLSYQARDAAVEWVKAYRANPDSTAIDETALSEELKPILQQRMTHQATLELIRRSSQGGDTAAVTAMLDKAANLGNNDNSIGIQLGKASFEQVRAVRALKRMPTGIPDLDYEIGGLVMGHEGVFIGGPGDGKSMALIHVACHALRQCFLVAYATLELDEAYVLGRITANLTDIPINNVMGPAEEQAEAKIEQMQAEGRVGGFIVKAFTPQATTVADIVEWCNQIKASAGRLPDMLVVDYADKMTTTAKQSEYLVMRDVYEGLRIFGRTNRIPVWTASQAKGKSKDHKELGLYSLADSLHKARVADLLVTLNVSEDKKTVKICVPKHRVGEAGQTIGPLPTAFALGRIVATAAPGVDYAAQRAKLKTATNSKKNPTAEALTADFSVPESSYSDDVIKAAPEATPVQPTHKPAPAKASGRKASSAAPAELRKGAGNRRATAKRDALFAPLPEDPPAAPEPAPAPSAKPYGMDPSKVVWGPPSVPSEDPPMPLDVDPDAYA